MLRVKVYCINALKVPSFVKKYRVPVSAHFITFEYFTREIYLATVLLITFAMKVLTLLSTSSGITAATLIQHLTLMQFITS